MKFENHPLQRTRRGGWADISLLRLNPENDRKDFGDFSLELAQLVCDPKHELTEDEKNEIKRVLELAHADDDKSMRWLVNSIIRFGIQEPLRGYWDGDEEIFTVTAGNRRTTGANIAKKVFGADVQEAPVDLEKSKNPLDFVYRQWVENSGRKDFSEMEKATNIQRMLDLGARPDDLPAVLGVSGRRVNELLNLLVLLPEAQEIVKNGEVAPTVAIEIAKEAQAESSNPVKASKAATERVITLARTAQANGQKATGKLAKELKRQELETQAQSDSELQAQLVDRRSSAKDTIDAALQAGLKDDSVLPRQIKLLLDGADPRTLKSIIRVLLTDSGVAIDALEQVAKNLERQVG